MEQYQYHNKLSAPVVLLFLMLWGIAMVYVTNGMNYTFSGVLVIAAVSFLVLFACLRYPLIGFYFTIVFSSVFALPGRFLNIASPVGILVEMCTCVLSVAVLNKTSLKSKDAVALWKHPVSVFLLVLLFYYLLELANPAMKSKIGWLFFFRKQISFFLFYYISYVVLNSYDKVRFFFKFWIVLVLIIAIYGIKQHWLGLASFEKSWLQSDPLIMKLFYQNGFLRKFSFLTDPAAFGIICAAFGIFSLIMAVRTATIQTKLLMYMVTVVFLVASSYSGSRTCNAMVIAALMAYAIFTLNERKTYWLLFAALASGILLLAGPLKNTPVVNRIKTTFKGSKDPSVAVRDNNRHNIQPFIHAHPFGGGLNTSGSEGVLYNRGHKLAGFPPDSGYMKILLEQGWIGFALHLVFYFLVLKRGIVCFFTAKDKPIKNVYIALTVCLFSLIVGQYSQLAIAQYPLVLFYYATLAILVKLIDFETDNPASGLPSPDNRQ